MNFTFPRTSFVDSTTLQLQTCKIHAEVLEACHENELWEQGMELFDIYHATETALRILHEKYNVDLGDLKDAVERKNRERGYYSTEG